VSRKKKRRGLPNASDRVSAREERVAQRAARVEGNYQKRQRKVLKRRVTKIGGYAIAAAALIAAYVFIPRSASYSVGGTGAVIAGVQTFSNPTGHLPGPIEYPQTPPAGGEHNPAWLNCGIYSEPVPNVYGVHSLEHGAVWVTYDPTLSPAELEALRLLLPSTYVILSPFPELPAPIVLSAWNNQLRVNTASDERIPMFFEEYWRSQYVPEPGALCNGGIEGVGRVS
jgi:hypothetical protein